MAAAAPPTPKAPSPSVTYKLLNREGVQGIRKALAELSFVGTSFRIQIARLERLDAAPGICKALSKALLKKKDVAPDLKCHVVQYKKVKAAATISKQLGSASKIFLDISTNPANFVLYARLTTLAKKMQKTVRPLPEPARRRVRRFANRLCRLAKRGGKYGEKKPKKIRDRVAVLAPKVNNLQATEVLIG